MKSSRVSSQPAWSAGVDLVQRYGVGVGTNLGALGKGDVVLIVAGDVEETAPVYMLRLKAAAERGAKFIVANARPTKMDRYAASLDPLSSRALKRRRSMICWRAINNQHSEFRIQNQNSAMKRRI